MKNILVTGSLAFDFIMDFPNTFEENILPEKLKTLSVSFLVKNFSKNFGGVAGNIAYNLSLLNQNPIILSSAGEEDFDIYQNHLQKNKVSCDFVNFVEKEFTANMFIITDKNNCQIAGFYAGAMEKDAQLKIDELHKKQKIDLAVVSPTMPSAMNNFVNESKKLNIPYLYDPAQQIPRIEKDDLINGINGAQILIGNDYEIELITKKTGFTKEQILGKVKILITTLGEKGSLIETKEDKFEIKSAKPEQIIDPTGAGDSYISGFLAGYLNNQPLKTAGQIGALLGTYAIEQYGTQKHRFTTEEFKKRYEESFEEILAL
ncbi:carbohydrate kinase family protein [Candidatus Microgenomates bacterium]|nr:MAG: carbohydrate kinase family protein [Candidatus Microgenomates bacterium]